MKKMYRIVSVILLFSLGFSSFAQPGNVNIKMSIVRDSILVGDQVRLEVMLTYPKTDSIALPVFEDQLAEGIEIVSVTDPSIKDFGDRIEMKVNYIVTSFDSGYHTLPYFPILRVSGGVNDTLKLGDPLKLKVGVVKVDEKFEGYDIRGIKKYPFDWRVILIIVLFAIIIGILIWRLAGRERIKSVLFLDTKSQRPPYEIALEGLTKVKSTKIWQQGKIKEYYTELTDIIRKYIEDTSGVQTMEKTSEEILQALSQTDYNKEDLIRILRDLFYYADLVKFAKYDPTAADNELSWQWASDYVNQSKPIHQQKIESAKEKEVEVEPEKAKEK